jgi:hypothetical protein
MANKKISQLTGHTAADVDNTNDVIAIVDSSGNETKKIVVGELLSSNTSLTDKNFVHNQIGLSSTWSVTHNLNKFPSVTIVDTAGTVITGEITYTNLNEATISFTSNGNALPQAGKAFFN